MIPGHIIHITSTVLNIFAVLTAFFGIYLGFHEAIKGIILNLLSRIIDTKKINSRMLTLAICAFIVITLTIWVRFVYRCWCSFSWEARYMALCRASFRFS